jgi:hypothetical protein
MKPVSVDTIKDIAHHLYDIDGDCDPELYKAIATLRQLINEEFKPTKSVTSQFIYDILSPCLEQMMKSELLDGMDMAREKVDWSSEAFEQITELMEENK